MIAQGKYFLQHKVNITTSARGDMEWNGTACILTWWGIIGMWVWGRNVMGMVWLSRIMR